MQLQIPVCLAALILFGSLNAAAQSPATNKALDSMDRITADSLHTPHYKVGVESSFPGGFHAWVQYLSENLQYPKKAIKRKIEGTVVVQFIVEKDGRVTDVEAISGDPLLMEEAVRIIKSSPDWIPARGDGKPLKSYKKQPIAFSLPK
jgi:TonB family protein